MKKILLLVFFAVLAFVATNAEGSKLSNRTKLLVKKSHDNALTGKMGVMSVVSEDNTVSAYVTVNNDYEDGVVERHGGVVRNHYRSIGVLTVEIPVASIEALAAEKCVVSIEVSQKVDKKMKDARSICKAQQLIDGVSPLTRPYLAEGVLVGIVDQEFQVNHINFYNSDDQSTLRIKRFLNQNNGKEYTDQASIEAAKYDVSYMESGHATHVLGMAAGSDLTTDYYGTAQKAEIVAVGTTGEDADLSDGVKYIFDYADEVGKPCVINISMGGLLGPHDGTETCNRVIESLIGPGRLVVAAAGNSGDQPMHVGKTLNGNDSLKTFVDLYYEFWYNYTLIDIWGEENQDYEVSFVVYSKSGDSIVAASPFFKALNDTSVSINLKKYAKKSGVDVSLDIAAGQNQYNNRGNIYVEYTKDDIPSNCYFGIIARGDSGTVNMWTYDQIAGFTDNNLSSRGWSDGDADLTIGTGVGDTRNVITVGSTTSKDISDFSSKGPLTTGQTKPEITAPGEYIISSIPDKNSLSYYREESTTVNGTTYYYGEMSGTSMASPYCTGVVACWLEVNNNLTYEDIMEIFQNTAKQDSYTGSVPNNTWGYGKLDAYAGLLYILGNKNDVNDITEQQKVIGYFGNGVAHIAGVSGDVRISVVDMSGKTVYSGTYGNVAMDDEVTIDMSDMPNGIYVINVNGENIKLIK